MSSAYISVCIPAYEMSGKGAEYLEFSLSRLAGQDFSDFEVVISDQSTDDGVKEICSRYESRLNIVFCENYHGKRQSSANLNNAIKKARGKIVKVLFQDDFLLGKDSLSVLAKKFDPDKYKWCVTACEHTNDGIELVRPFYPRYNRFIQFGKNTISSPSVLAFVNDKPLFFDENIVWLMDVEFYRRCYDRYGEPQIINEILVVNRWHKGQVSASVSRDLVISETEYVFNKFKDRMGMMEKLVYYFKYRPDQDKG